MQESTAMTCSIKQVANALTNPGRDADTQKVVTFISQSVECFCLRYPAANYRFIVMLEDMVDGTHRHKLRKDMFSFPKDAAVCAYMDARFEDNAFDTDVHIAVTVCYDRECEPEDANIGVIAYNACALQWVSLRYGLTLKDAALRVNRMAAARNQLSLTWSELLNLTGEKLTTCVNYEDHVAEADVRHCGDCRAATYCSRECQKADWAHHKLRCSAVAGAVHRRCHARFAEYYNAFGSSDTSADSWIAKKTTSRPPKCVLEDLSLPLRKVVAVHKSRFCKSVKS